MSSMSRFKGQFNQVETSLISSRHLSYRLQLPDWIFFTIIFEMIKRFSAPKNFIGPTETYGIHYLACFMSSYGSDKNRNW